MGNKLSNNIIKTRKSKNEVLEIIRAKTDNRKIETMFSLESGLETQSTDKYFYVLHFIKQKEFNWYSKKEDYFY